MPKKVIIISKYQNECYIIWSNLNVKISEKDDKVAIGTFTLYFFKTRLNETYIASVPFAVLQWHLSVPQSFIFS